MRRFLVVLLVVAACGNSTTPSATPPTAPLRGPSAVASPTLTQPSSLSSSPSSVPPSQSFVATSSPTPATASPSLASLAASLGTPIPGFDYRDDDQVQVRHILISPNHDPNNAPALNPSDPAWAAAKAQADQIYAQVSGDPASFPAVAASTSDDLATRDSGGLLPFYGRAELTPLFANAIFATNLVPGEILAPIQSPFGWHVIQFVDRRHAPKGDYTCTAQLQPVIPADPVNGQTEQDLGFQHVQVGTSVTYAVCPPASGQHYNSAGLGPIAPRFYGPDDNVVPQGWIHNLEHGGLVVLYRCGSTCPASVSDPLRPLLTSLPRSPLCGLDPGQLSPVIARFDEMAAPYAAILWHRVLFLQSPDLAAIATFYTTWAERENREHLC